MGFGFRAATPPGDFFGGGMTPERDTTPQAVDHCHRLLAWIIPNIDGSSVSPRRPVGAPPRRDRFCFLAVLAPMDRAEGGAPTGGDGWFLFKAPPRPPARR